MLRVYNTLTRKKEEFKPLEAGKVRMYVCGPTVYSDAHIGHAMSSIVFDVIRRYFEYRGYAVKFVMNYTDVDDKIIIRANALGKDPQILAESYIQAFQRHMGDLNVMPASANPRATQTMDKILAMIQGLIDKGFAYPAKNGDVYFRVEKDPGYGKLSGRKLTDMQAGARIEVSEDKENPLDFAIWKSAKPGEPAWDSPWGKGRPGWHIECSAMNLAEFGEQIDIHGGGNDLVFPHHENEIAQSECFTGKPFARYWIHNGMMQLQGEKMSKSLGNLVTIDEFLKTHEADSLRMMVLNGSYRAPLAYSDEIVQAAERGLDRMRSALKPAASLASGAQPEILKSLDGQSETTQQTFVETMDDDINSAGGLAALFELVRVINTARDGGATDAQLLSAQKTLRTLTGVLGLRLEQKKSGSVDVEKWKDYLLELHKLYPDQVPDPIKEGLTEGALGEKWIKLLVDLRNSLRKAKDFKASDLIRNGLKERGVLIEDSKDGTTWGWG
jgi:cysteinyl-tRNA synthetase